MEDLNELRKKINEIDDAMTALFLKRMEVVRQVAEYKKQNNMEVLDKSREAQLIQKHLDKLSTDEQKQQMKAFLEGMIQISRNAQSELISKAHYVESHMKPEAGSCIGYQGVVGSFSHQAALDYFGGDVQTIHYLNFKDVFEALKKDEIAYGVLPIENSSTGGIAEVYDLLGLYHFAIVGEKCIKVEQQLLGVAGTTLADIKEVYSHAQGFMQCSRFFEEHPGWKLIPYYNTAKSAEYVKQENQKSKACVAARKAAEVYGLDIIAENINDNNRNHTRFIIIAKDLKVTEACNKISVVIHMPHRPGALYGVMKHFAEHSANMLKIESRPIVDRFWEYCFYIDFSGNIMDENIKQMLLDIETENVTCKLLGNYKSEVEGR